MLRTQHQNPRCPPGAPHTMDGPPCDWMCILEKNSWGWTSGGFVASPVVQNPKKKSPEVNVQWTI